MEFIRNIWYAAGWTDEITRKPLGRTYLNEDVVLYRREDGTPVALQDLCPHRFVPLSKGALVGDNIECGYHGLQFDGSGACVANPHQSGVVPRAAKVRTYPVTDKFGLTWIWMGEPALADPATVPDYSFYDPNKLAEAHGTLLLNCNYLLAMDNLTDLSHAAILHPVLQGRDLTKADYNARQTGEEVHVVQFAPAMEVPPIMTIMKGITGKWDQWLEMRYLPPSCMTTFIFTGIPGEPKEKSLGIYAPNIITPATDTTAHYFWGVGRNFDTDSTEMTEKFRAGAGAAFQHEDAPMLESQQRYLGIRDLMDLRPVLLSNDEGAVRARRIVEKRIKEERERQPAREEAFAK